MLAPQSVRVARILGTGVQAYWQARALFSERKFERLLIWSRDREKAVALKEQFAPWLSRVKIEVIGNVKEVVETTEVLVTATTAREPIVRGEWLRPGQHITAVGADDNTKCELDARCLQRANRLIVGSRESAKDHGEVHRWLKQGALIGLGAMTTAKAAADAGPLHLRNSLLDFVLMQELLRDWQQGTELGGSVYRVAATIPLNGIQFDPEAFVTRLRAEGA